MEIHKPHAVKTWREFSIEIGTIVCGILIALGLEQTVEWLHWRHTVELAREALNEEMAFNDGYLVQRVAWAPCVDARIAVVERALAKATRTGQIEPIGSADFNLSGPTDDNQWVAERAAQSLTHFPRRELSELSRYYSIMDAYKQVWLAAESEDWLRLSGLNEGPRPISPQELAEMRYHLASARRMENLITLTARAALEYSARRGIKPKLRGRVTSMDRVCEGLATRSPSPTDASH